MDEAMRMVRGRIRTEATQPKVLRQNCMFQCLAYGLSQGCGEGVPPTARGATIYGAIVMRMSEAEAEPDPLQLKALRFLAHRRQRHDAEANRIPLDQILAKAMPTPQIRRREREHE
jgi:hypothetical protein